MQKDFTEIIAYSKMKKFYIFVISLFLVQSIFGNLSDGSSFMRFYEQVIKEQIEKNSKVDSFENLLMGKIFDGKKNLSPTTTNSNYMVANVDAELDMDETNLFDVFAFSKTRVKRKANETRNQTRKRKKHRTDKRISRRKLKRKMKHINRSNRLKWQKRDPVLFRRYRFGRIVEITSTSGLGRNVQASDDIIFDTSLISASNWTERVKHAHMVVRIRIPSKNQNQPKFSPNSIKVIPLLTRTEADGSLIILSRPTLVSHYPAKNRRLRQNRSKRWQWSWEVSRYHFAVTNFGQQASDEMSNRTEFVTKSAELSDWKLPTFGLSLICSLNKRSVDCLDYGVQLAKPPKLILKTRYDSLS